MYHCCNWILKCFKSTLTFLPFIVQMTVRIDEWLLRLVHLNPLSLCTQEAGRGEIMPGCCRGCGVCVRYRVKRVRTLQAVIGPQLQLWAEQQVCAGCAQQKSLGGRNGTAQTEPDFSTSPLFQPGLRPKLRVDSTAEPAV